MTVKNVFHDPAGTLSDYTWHINHLESDGPSRPNNIDFQGRSDNLGVIGMAGDWSPLIMNLSGRLIHLEQHKQFLGWRHITNTFKFSDFEGGEYEVSMVGYEYRKQRVAWNPADANMRHYIVDYKMDLWIVRIISGELFDMGVPE